MTERTLGRLLASPPLAWLVLLMFGPMALSLALSLGWSFTTESRTSFPDASAYAALVSDPLYLRALFSSVELALVSALIALLIGFPMAFWVARKPEPLRSLLLAAISLPLWVSFLVRVYAWMILLGSSGPINDAMLGLGLSDEPLNLLHSNAAACIGIAYSYLPFVIFPIYASLTQQDPHLEDAAADLGAPPAATLLRVTIPLSRYGIIAGVLLIFVPALGELVIPELLGGTDTLTLGRVLWTEFFSNRDWARSSAIAVVLLLLTAGLFLLSALARRREEQS